MTTQKPPRHFNTDASGSGFAAADVQLLFTSGFRADYSCELLELPGLAIAFGQDTADRVAFVSLRGEHNVITLPAAEGATIFLSGEPLRYGHMAVHQPGDRFHERVAAGGEWVRLFVPAGFKFATSKGDRVPLLSGHFPLRRLAINQTKLAVLLAALRAAMETGATDADDADGTANRLREMLAECFQGARVIKAPAAARRRNDVMLRFQDFMAFWCERPMHIPDICQALSLPARTLEDYCQAQCGVSAYRLLRLFRLNQVHAALEVATPSTDSVTAASRRYGFLDLGRFAATYRAAFHELPSQTLARAPGAPTRRAEHAGHERSLAAG